MKQLLRVLVLAGMGLAPTAAHAGPFILDNYTRSGPSESFVAPFTSFSTLTSNTYSGPVEVLVSGTGFSLFSSLNDAFYGVPGGAPYDSQYYQLNVGWASAPLAPFSGEARNINNFIEFVEGVGAVTTTPAYDAATHTYHFVINTPVVASQLQFGVSDGNFGDNGGQYNISLWQLQRGAQSEAIPVPGAAALLAFGLLGLGASRRRLNAPPVVA